MVSLRSGRTTPSSTKMGPKSDSEVVFERDVEKPLTPAKTRESDHSQSSLKGSRKELSASRKSARLSLDGCAISIVADGSSVSGKRKKGLVDEYQRRNARLRGEDAKNCSSNIENESGVRFGKGILSCNDADEMDKVRKGGLGNTDLEGGINKMEVDLNTVGNLGDGLKRKGKEKIVESVAESSELRGCSSGSANELLMDRDAPDNSIDVDLDPENQVSSGTSRNQRMRQFRDIARSNASRFARDVDDRRETFAQAQDDEAEDWPGPFSSAMKIIRDRTNKVNSQRKVDHSAGRDVTWVPKEKSVGNLVNRLPSSLQDLCLGVLAINFDAISSLEGVPDTLRHKLSHMVCKSQNMNDRFFGLLLQGSPTEICVENCSWLEEDAFIKYFKEFDASSLKVLQLDQCGRSIADYSILSTFARSPCCMPGLSTLSITGAYRLSDNALKSLLHATPNLVSVNLSQCSLLTSASIHALSNVRELYIDECESMNFDEALPALIKFQHLEVLSLSGIRTATDDSMKELVFAQGHNLKELILGSCLELTDTSLKAISDFCPKLCVLDISNLEKLTDASLGFLANSRREIRTLKASRNAFSDEAIAAYLEASGIFLKNLSLNNLSKVDLNTALALAKFATSLSTLDLSWCRKLTDDLVGLVVDNCLSLRMLKIFGCSQITNTFFHGHSNPYVKIIGSSLSPLLVSSEMSHRSHPWQ